MEYEKELEVGSQDDMLAHASEFYKGFNNLDDSSSLLGMAVIMALFGGKSPEDIKKMMEESNKPTTLKSLEKQVKLTTASIFELLSIQQKKIDELESKIGTIKKSLKR